MNEQKKQSAIHFLYALHKFGMKFGLRNIRSLLRFAGNPHRKIKTIHVAGTNGKGSTSSMIAAILTAAGYRVGLYTSPHLVRFNERIRINGMMISDDDVIRYTKTLRPEITRLKGTFFEATTAMAFKYFADQKVDFAVIETGLGGRLDSTNVLTPLVSVITSIGKDHTEQLGNTIASIAGEKAGIIKKRIPVVIGTISGAAQKVILGKAKENRSPVIFSSKIDLPEGIELQLKGKHQIANARSAVAAINIVSRTSIVGNNAIKIGLERTSQLSGLRGRFEMIGSKPHVLLDVAHNPDGIKTLVSELKKLMHDRIVVLFAVMKDKDHASMVRHLKKLDPIMIVTQPATDRALSSPELFSVGQKEGIRSFQMTNPRAAFRLAKLKAGNSGLVVVTGSHYLVGEVIPLLKKTLDNKPELP